MLKLREEQVENFKEWKQDYLEKIDLMREVIKTSNPKGYAENSFWNTLGEIATMIDEFDVETNEACYKGLITNEIVFGYSIKEFLVEIDSRIAEYEMAKIVKEIFSKQGTNLWKIFVL